MQEQLAQTSQFSLNYSEGPKMSLRTTAPTNT